MEALNFVSEHALLASGRISKKTLDRYTESGHLRAYLNPEGQRRYRLEDLQELFGISGLQPDEIKEPLTGYEHLQAGQSQGPLPKLERSPLAAAANSLAGIQSIQAAGIETRAPRSMPSAEPATEPTAAANVQDGPLEPPLRTRKVELDDTEVPAPTHPAAPLPPTPVAPSENAQEANRLLRLLEHQENLLEDRDIRIKELIEERRWLRDRVEKLEEQLARTQVLMLSGNQTIQELVTQRKAGPSPILKALAWLGFAQLPQPPESENPQQHQPSNSGQERPPGTDQQQAREATQFTGEQFSERTDASRRLQQPGPRSEPGRRAGNE